MGLLKRITDILHAHANAVLDAAEDPTKMMEQSLADMQTQMREATQQVTHAVADGKRLRAQADAAAADAAQWEQRAVAALQAGKEDLAKQAVAQRNAKQEAAKALSDQATKQEEAVAQLEHGLQQLQSKIDHYHSKKEILVAREKAAEAQAHIHETINGLTENSAFEVFDRMEQKVADKEAQAQAQVEVGTVVGLGDLETQFQELDHNVDNDIAELRSRMGMADGTAERTVEVQH